MGVVEGAGSEPKPSDECRLVRESNNTLCNRKGHCLEPAHTCCCYTQHSC